MTENCQNIPSLAVIDFQLNKDKETTSVVNNQLDEPKQEKMILNSFRFWCLFFHSSCFTFFSGYVTAEFNTMLNHLPHIYGWDDSEKSMYSNLCNSLPMLGAASIAFWSGQFAQKLGRRKSLMLFSVVLIIGSILTLFRNTPLLIIGRILQGSTFAIFSTVSPLYSQEVLVTEYRAKSGTLISGCQGLGVLVAFMMGFGLPSDPTDTENKFFYVPLSLPAILMTIHLILFIFVFKDETPTFYLLQKNDHQSAQNFFQKLYGQSYVEREMEAILAVKKENEEVDKQKKISFCDLFNAKYRYRTLLALELNVTSVYTAVSVLSVYSTQIFENSYSTNVATMFSIATTLGDILLPPLSNIVIQWFGKKNSCIYGCFGLILCECIFSRLGFAGQEKAMAFFIIIHRLVFSLTVGPFNWSYPYEICPPEGLGIYIMQFYILMYISLYTFPLLVSSFGIEAAFLVYAGIMLMSTLINMKYVQHIDNCTIKDIQDIFDLRKIKTMVNLSDYNTSPSHKRFNRRNMSSKPPTIVLTSLANIKDCEDGEIPINMNKQTTELNINGGSPQNRFHNYENNNSSNTGTFIFSSSGSQAYINNSPLRQSPLKRGNKKQKSAIIMQKVVSNKPDLEIVQEVNNEQQNNKLEQSQQCQTNNKQEQQQEGTIFDNVAQVRKVSKTINIPQTSDRQQQDDIKIQQEIEVRTNQADKIVKFQEQS
ncbi:hypothetical protein ABPG72_000715 [Tetrahymena utriculariae]